MRGGARRPRRRSTTTARRARVWKPSTVDAAVSYFNCAILPALGHLRYVHLDGATLGEAAGRVAAAIARKVRGPGAVWS